MNFILLNNSFKQDKYLKQFHELKKSLMSILSLFGSVSKGIIFNIMFVSHMDFLSTRNPINIRNKAARESIVKNTIKAVIKSLSNFWIYWMTLFMQITLSSFKARSKTYAFISIIWIMVASNNSFLNFSSVLSAVSPRLLNSRLAFNICVNMW